ncbi:hypothetical protein COLO4_22241 [Corchorus olitorius]|uniref:Uncharacterized protein n=1 Tax=Corchorus olitorius TaxID=93759 RepID=A0A1R3INA8_9ROSI|nr:hypothetical protein COLO4_22241 [Corchorus olitorius]
MELSTANSKRDGLRKEVETLKLLLEKHMVISEDSTFPKEGELEETIEKQRVELENISAVQSQSNEQAKESEKNLQAKVELLEKSLKEKEDGMVLKNNDALLVIEEEYNTKLAAKETEIIGLKVKSPSLSRKGSQKMGLEVEVTELGKELAQKMIEIQRLKDVVLSKEDDNVELRRNQSELEAEVSNLQQELERIKHGLEIHLSELEDENKQSSLRLSSLESQLQDLQDERDSIQLQLREMEAQKIEMEKQLQDMHEQWLTSQDRCEYLSRENTKLQANVETLIEECNSLQKSAEELEEDKSKLEEFASKEKNLTLELKAVHDKNKKLEAKVQNLQQEVETLAKQISTMHHENEKTAYEAQCEISGLHADKSRLKSTLQEAESKSQMVYLEEKLKRKILREIPGDYKSYVEELEGQKMGLEVEVTELGKELAHKRTEMQRLKDAVMSKEEDNVELRWNQSELEAVVSNLHTQLPPPPSHTQQLVSLGSRGRTRGLFFSGPRDYNFW